MCASPQHYRALVQLILPDRQECSCLKELAEVQLRLEAVWPTVWMEVAGGHRTTGWKKWRQFVEEEIKHIQSFRVSSGQELVRRGGDLDIWLTDREHFFPGTPGGGRGASSIEHKLSWVEGQVGGVTRWVG